MTATTGKSGGVSPYKWARLGLFVLFIQIFAFGLWAGPQVKQDEQELYCVSNIRLGDFGGHSMNCDSYDFLKEAVDFRKLTGPDAMRQDRPGFIVSAGLLAYPFYMLMDAITPGAPKTITINGAEEMDMLKLASSYFAFVVLNILFLTLAYRLYLYAIGLPPGTKALYGHAAAWMGLFVFINNITKQFLWSPHSQILHIVSVMAAIWGVKTIATHENPARMFRILALVCGVGQLFYALFVLPITIIGLGYLWRERHIFSKRRFEDIARLAFIFLTAIGLFALPFALWCGLVHLLSGGFHHTDIQTYKGFIWLPEMWRNHGANTVLAGLAGNLLSMFGGALRQGWGFILLLGGLVALARRKQIVVPDAGLLWAGAALYIVLSALFFTFYGLTALRLSYPLVVALFPLIGAYILQIEKQSKQQGRLLAATVAGTAAYTIFMIMKFGPYS